MFSSTNAFLFFFLRASNHAFTCLLVLVLSHPNANASANSAHTVGVKQASHPRVSYAVCNRAFSAAFIGLFCFFFSGVSPVATVYGLNAAQFVG